MSVIYSETWPYLMDLKCRCALYHKSQDIVNLSFDPNMRSKLVIFCELVKFLQIICFRERLDPRVGPNILSIWWISSNDISVKVRNK